MSQQCQAIFFPKSRKEKLYMFLGNKTILISPFCNTGTTLYQEHQQRFVIQHSYFSLQSIKSTNRTATENSSVRSINNLTTSTESSLGDTTLEEQTHPIIPNYSPLISTQEKLQPIFPHITAPTTFSFFGEM